MEIRLARPEDAEAIAHVHVTSWAATYPGIVPQAYLDSLEMGQFTERWKQYLAAEARWQKHFATEATMSVCVAEAGDGVCGFAAGGPIREPVLSYDGELYAIYLLPTGQGKGTGRKLFVQMAGVLADRGLKSLLVWILRHNPATGFYERLGGELVAEDAMEIGGENLPIVAYGWTNLAIRSWR